MILPFGADAAASRCQVSKHAVFIVAWALACAAAEPAPPPPAAGERVRGHLVWGHESRSFRECGEGREGWVVDATGGDLAEVVGALVTAPYEPLFVEVRGEWQAPPDAGFAEAYPEALRIGELLRAEREGFGCDEDLAGIRFLARGNEPGWRLELRDDGASFSSMAAPQGFVLPAPEVEPADDGIRFRAGDALHRLDGVISERRCIDSMSGSRFELTAAVRLDGLELSGCAVRGLPAR